jgi:hypothetical protein
MGKQNRTIDQNEYQKSDICLHGGQFPKNSVRKMSFSSPKDTPGPTGFPGLTTPTQDEAINELRSEISPLLSGPGGQYLIKMMGGEDYFYCRMLRARKWDVKAATQLVSEILEYRAEHNIDSVLHRVLGDQKPQDPLNPTWRPKILDETIAKVTPLLPCGRHGYTNTGQTLEIWYSHHHT